MPHQPPTDLTPDEQLIYNLCDDPKVGVSWFKLHAEWGWYQPVENERVRVENPRDGMFDGYRVLCKCGDFKPSMLAIWWPPKVVRMDRPVVTLSRHDFVTRYPRIGDLDRYVAFIGQCEECDRIYWAVVHKLGSF